MKAWYEVLLLTHFRSQPAVPSETVANDKCTKWCMGLGEPYQVAHGLARPGRPRDESMLAGEDPRDQRRLFGPEVLVAESLSQHASRVVEGRALTSAGRRGMPLGRLRAGRCSAQL